eukprot:534568-Rhodomonas_salina.5
MIASVSTGHCIAEASDNGLLQYPPLCSRTTRPGSTYARSVLVLRIVPYAGAVPLRGTALHASLDNTTRQLRTTLGIAPYHSSVPDFS